MHRHGLGAPNDSFNPIRDRLIGYRGWLWDRIWRQGRRSGLPLMAAATDRKQGRILMSYLEPTTTDVQVEDIDDHVGEGDRAFRSLDLWPTEEGCSRSVEDLVARRLNVFVVVHSLSMLRCRQVDGLSRAALVPQGSVFRDRMPRVVRQVAGEGELR